MAKVHASYFYDYLPATHLDELQAWGFNTALIKFIGTGAAAEQTEWAAFVAKAAADAITPYPIVNWQNSARLAADSSDPQRRYSPNRDPYPDVPCPCDQNYIASLIGGRMSEFSGTRIGLDPELQSTHSSLLHVYKLPCKCQFCLNEWWFKTQAMTKFSDGVMIVADAITEDPTNDVLLNFQAGWCYQRLYAALLTASAFTAVVILDSDPADWFSIAFARAIARAGKTNLTFTERTYSTGAAALPRAAWYGGLWLKQWSPAALTGAIASMLAAAPGYWAFTSYSLAASVDPASLTGPYLLPLGTRAAYITALTQANATGP